MRRNYAFDGLCLFFFSNNKKVVVNFEIEDENDGEATFATGTRSRATASSTVVSRASNKWEIR